MLRCACGEGAFRQPRRNRAGRRGVYPVTMRTALIAISLCLALGAAACTSEEERQKAQLRAQIEEGLVEYEAVLERYNAVIADLDPDAPTRPNTARPAYQYVLSNDPEPRLLRVNLEQLEGSIELIRDQTARWEEQLARRTEGEPGPNEAAVKRLFGGGSREK